MDLAGETSQSIAAISTMIAEVDVVSFSDDELGQLVIEAEALVNAAHALSATALDAFDHRGTWAADGAPSAAGWVAARTGTARRTLRTRTRAGGGLRLLPSEASVPDRYRVVVVVHAGGNGPLPAAACDAPALRLVLSAPGDVLDVGRLTQQWSASIRRAITYRDGGCVFPGCDRPPSWCDIHHCQPWNKDGKTSIDNGALLCRRHHTFIHKRHWRIAIEEGRAVTRRPDGTRYVIQRWPASPAA